MKKILPMILLLTFSLPSYAALVTLRCDTDGFAGGQITSPKKYVESYAFDAAKGIVLVENTEYSVNTKCQTEQVSEHDCTEAYINDRAFGTRWYSKDRTNRAETVISRVYGSFSYTDDYKSLNLNRSGKCVPFKQAF